MMANFVSVLSQGVSDTNGAESCTKACKEKRQYTKRSLLVGCAARLSAYVMVQELREVCDAA